MDIQGNVRFQSCDANGFHISKRNHLTYLHLQVDFVGLHNSIGDNPLIEPATPFFVVNKVTIDSISLGVFGHINDDGIPKKFPVS